MNEIISKGVAFVKRLAVRKIDRPVLDAPIIPLKDRAWFKEFREEETYQPAKLDSAIIDVVVREIPELRVIASSLCEVEDNSEETWGFKSNIYRNRVEQMYEALRRSKKDTFTLEEAQRLSGLETNIKAAVSWLADKGYVKRTGYKRQSTLYTGERGRPQLSDRLHLEYKLVLTRWYEPSRSYYGRGYNDYTETTLSHADFTKLSGI